MTFAAYMIDKVKVSNEYPKQQKPQFKDK